MTSKVIVKHLGVGVQMAFERLSDTGTVGGIGEDGTEGAVEDLTAWKGEPTSFRDLFPKLQIQSLQLLVFADFRRRWNGIQLSGNVIGCFVGFESSA